MEYRIKSIKDSNHNFYSIPQAKDDSLNTGWMNICRKVANGTDISLMLSGVNMMVMKSQPEAFDVILDYAKKVKSTIVDSRMITVHPKNVAV